MNTYSNIMNMFCRIDKTYKSLLNESQENDSISKAKKLVRQRLGYSEQEANEFVRMKLRGDVTELRTKRGGKFILGVTRMFLDGEIRDASTIMKLNNTIKLVASDAHYNEYDRNLNGMHCQDLIDKFSGEIKQIGDEDRNKLSQMQFKVNTDYRIVRIDSFEQAEEYGDYTNWCITHDEDSLDEYTSNGIGQFYFCLRNGFEQELEVKGENAPLDSYGLSMVAVSVDEDGNLHTCNCRWNRNNGGNDHIMDTQQISELIGMNFYNVFKPNTRWKDMLADAMNKLKNGVPWENVFDEVYENENGIFAVTLNEKWNLINTNGELLQDQWFDDCSNFINGFAIVRIKLKYNYINAKGNVLCGQWFDYCYNFVKGLAKVKLKGKWNWIDTNGELLQDQWFDNCSYFENGLAKVELNGKWFVINTKGEIVG